MGFLDVEEEDMEEEEDVDFDFGRSVFLFLFSMVISIKFNRGAGSETGGGGDTGVGVDGVGLDACFLFCAFMVNSDRDNPGIGPRDTGGGIGVDIGVDIGAGTGTGVGIVDVEMLGDDTFVPAAAAGVEAGKGEFKVANLAFCSSINRSKAAFFSSCALTKSISSMGDGGAGAVVDWIVVGVSFGTFLSSLLRSSSILTFSSPALTLTLAFPTILLVTCFKFLSLSS